MSILNFNRVQLYDDVTERKLGKIIFIHRIPNIGEYISLRNKNESDFLFLEVTRIVNVWDMDEPDPQNRCVVNIHVRQI